MKCDYLIVGSGIFGSTFARLATDQGKKCLIIDKRKHIGGNCYTKMIEGINVHQYGAHIFHTNNKTVWRYVNKFASFNNYINSPKAVFNGKIYSLPFNMNTFHELWGVQTPQQAKEIIEKQRFLGNPTNLEEQSLSLVGKDVYEKLIKYYTKKQWGKEPTELPTSIIKRIPIRFTFDNNYFDDEYQGIPIGGYTKLFDNMLNGIKVETNTDYFCNREYFNSIANKIVYTGCIDEFFDYDLGTLDYRSLEFKTKIVNTNNYQGVAVINYTDLNCDYTRSIEHKHFEKNYSNNSVITYEYPKDHTKNLIPYYPINDYKNERIYMRYYERSKRLTNFIFGGRLATYKYLNMDTTIKCAMNTFSKNNI
jgi:UDP-galactopyranose mutase